MPPFTNIAELQSQITAAYTRLDSAQVEAFNKLTARQSADALVAETRQGILLQHADDPKQLGGNEAARNARIEELMHSELAAQSAAVREQQQADHELRRAQTTVECTRAILRTVEVAAGIDRQSREAH